MNSARLVFVAIFFLAAFILIDKNEDGNFIRFAGQNVRVEIADTPAERELGLSGRERLGEKEGMIFVFDSPGRHAFWMKDMLFPLDIIWLDENLKVIYIKKDARPESYPEIFLPGEDAKYVLEVVAGFADKYNLKEGDGVELNFKIF